MKVKIASIILLGTLMTGQPKVIYGQTTDTATGGTTVTTTVVPTATTTVAPTASPTGGPTAGIIDTNRVEETENANRSSWVANIIALSPILLHIILLIWVWRSKMNIKEALSDKETIRQEVAANAIVQIEQTRSLFPKTPYVSSVVSPDPTTMTAMINAQQSLKEKYLEHRINLHNDLHTKSMVGGDQETIRVSSVSRLIVFMAGHAAVALGSCLASFIIYYMLIVKPDASVPSLNGFVGVLLALGIGVVPYAVNRFTSTGNETPSQQ